MNKSLNALVIPVIVMILAVGVILPVFNTIQEERCSLAFSRMVESDLLFTESAERIITEQSETIDYLMKHPKQTLKNCMTYEDNNFDGSRNDLLWYLAKSSYKEITDENLADDPVSLNATIKIRNPELYAELMEK